MKILVDILMTIVNTIVMDTQTSSQEAIMSAAILQAIAEWKSGAAYRDNAGNYRVRVTRWCGRYTGRGPIASWNKAVKHAGIDLHVAAKGA